MFWNTMRRKVVTQFPVNFPSKRTESPCHARLSHYWHKCCKMQIFSRIRGRFLFLMKSIYHSHESISIFSLSCNLHLTGVLKLTHLSSDNVLKRAEELKSQNLDLRGSKSLLFSFPCRKSIQFAESWQLVVCIGNEFQFHFLLQDKFLFIGIINLINYSLLTF